MLLTKFMPMPQWVGSSLFPFFNAIIQFVLIRYPVDWDKVPFNRISRSDLPIRYLMKSGDQAARGRQKPPMYIYSTPPATPARARGRGLRHGCAVIRPHLGHPERRPLFPPLPPPLMLGGYTHRDDPLQSRTRRSTSFLSEVDHRIILSPNWPAGWCWHLPSDHGVCVLIIEKGGGNLRKKTTFVISSVTYFFVIWFAEYKSPKN